MCVSVVYVCVLLYHSLPCSLETGSLAKPGARPAASKTQGHSCLPYLPALGSQTHVSLLRVLHGCWEFELMLLFLTH